MKNSELNGESDFLYKELGNPTFATTLKPILV